jgi:hypothetical protein
MQGGISAEAGALAEQRDTNGPAQALELDGGDEAVAAVVSLAATNDDPPAARGSSNLAEEIRYAAPGVFHQHQAAQAVLGYGKRIQSAKLIAG